MGKPARWLKSVLLGKKPSKSSGSKDKERVVNGKEVVVISKIEESDVVSDLPSFGNPTVHTSGAVETQTIEHEAVSDDEIQLPKVQIQPRDSSNAASVLDDDSLSESDKIMQEIAATTVQAAFRGYLARRAFWALKGIIRLQALIRGHMVRRQAVATLYCVMGIVRLQALARGREIRHSDIGVEVQRKCQLSHQQNKLHGDSVVDTHTYLGIKKLTANAFAQKLLASSPKVMPVHLENDSSNSVWLENWSASCFWKPIPQPKKTSSVKKTQKKFATTSQIVEEDYARPKKSVRRVPTSNLDNPSAAEFEKPKRSSFRKFSTSQSVELLPHPGETPQVDLEKVKRGLRKVHNPVVENSIQPQGVPEKEIEKPAPALEEPIDEEKTDEKAVTVVEQQLEELKHIHEPLVVANETRDSPLVNQIEESVIAEEKEDVKEERTPKQNNKENKKSRKKDSPVTTTQTTECEESSNGNQNSSQGLPSYMQATKSAKAKLRLQGSSSSPKQQGTEKATRRYSLPSSGNNARVTSDSPKTTRVSNSGGKTGKKTEKPISNGKTAPVEWKR